MIEANVPPVAFNVPELSVAPMVPAEILAVPALPTFRLPRLTDETSRPPVTLARFVTDPPVRVDVPAETASELRTAVLLRIPAEFTTFAVPAVRLAVAPEATVRLPRMAAFVVNVPAVTFDSPVTLADPAVRLAVAPEATVRLPRTAAFVVKVPAVTFDRPVTFAVFRLVVLL